MHEIKCAEVWGGNADIDEDCIAPGLIASVYSRACDSGGPDAGAAPEHRGGDIYYISVCDAGNLTRIALADVAGHGVSVSEVSGWLYDSLQQRMNDPGSDAILQDLNVIATERGIEAMATAAIAGVFSPKAVMFHANAGHHPLLVKRKGETDWMPVAAEVTAPGGRPSGLPLGVLAEVDYQQSTTGLAPGDRVCLISDGVIEAPAKGAGGPEGFYGLDRLQALLAKAGEAPLPEVKAAILTDLRDYCGGELTHDDVTILLVEAT